MEEINDERYEHGQSCSPIVLKSTLHPDILECSECAGMFDRQTKEGISIMDQRIV